MANAQCIPESKKRMNCSFSKKRYQDILHEMSSMGIDDRTIQLTADIICKVLGFDPDYHSRSSYQLEYIHKKAKELGVSTYVASGRKAHYMRSKEQKMT